MRRACVIAIRHCANKNIPLPFGICATVDSYLFIEHARRTRRVCWWNRKTVERETAIAWALCSNEFVFNAQKTPSESWRLTLFTDALLFYIRWHRFFSATHRRSQRYVNDVGSPMLSPWNKIARSLVWRALFLLFDHPEPLQKKKKKKKEKRGKEKEKERKKIGLAFEVGCLFSQPWLVWCGLRNWERPKQNVFRMLLRRLVPGPGLDWAYARRNTLQVNVWRVPREGKKMLLRYIAKTNQPEFVRMSACNVRIEQECKEPTFTFGLLLDANFACTRKKLAGCRGYCFSQSFEVHSLQQHDFLDENDTN